MAQDARAKRRLVLGLALFVAVQFVVLGVVGSLPAAVKATLCVAGIVIAIGVVRWFRAGDLQAKATMPRTRGR